MKRSDQSVAIYGVILIGWTALVGYVVLAALGKDAPEALLTLVVVAAVSGTLGWARGGTYYDPTPEVVPTPAAPDAADALADVRAHSTATPPRPTSTPAVYPLHKPDAVHPIAGGPAEPVADKVNKP